MAELDVRGAFSRLWRSSYPVRIELIDVDSGETLCDVTFRNREALTNIPKPEWPRVYRSRYTFGSGNVYELPAVIHCLKCNSPFVHDVTGERSRFCTPCRPATA